MLFCEHVVREICKHLESSYFMGQTEKLLCCDCSPSVHVCGGLKPIKLPRVQKRTLRPGMYLQFALSVYNQSHAQYQYL